MKRLKICFMGGSQAGIIGALTLLSAGHRIISAVSYYKELDDVLKRFNIPIYSNVKSSCFLEALKKSDLLISVHGREIIDEKYLVLPKLCCVNVHPYLYKYKGARPVERAIKEKNFRASVGVHIMGKEVDGGDVLIEEFVSVKGLNTIDGIYNKLYPYYSLALLKALNIIAKGLKNKNE